MWEIQVKEKDLNLVFNFAKEKGIKIINDGDDHCQLFVATLSEYELLSKFLLRN